MMFNGGREGTKKMHIQATFYDEEIKKLQGIQL